MSVACAITLYQARTSREKALGRHGDLDAGQQDILTAAMLLRHKVKTTVLACGSLGEDFVQRPNPLQIDI